MEWSSRPVRFWSQVNSDPKSALGTLAYTAPEALMHNFFDGSSSDVWSCGVMLYIMVTGASFRQHWLIDSCTTVRLYGLGKIDA